MKPVFNLRCSKARRSGLKAHGLHGEVAPDSNHAYSQEILLSVFIKRDHISHTCITPTVQKSKAV